MKMKLMQWVLVPLFVLSFGVLYGQDKSNEERAKMLTEKMKKDLTLNDDQYEKAYTINLAFINKMTQLKNSGGGRLAKARKLKDADGERDKMLKGVLTDEQYKKYKEQKSSNREEMKKRAGQRRG